MNQELFDLGLEGGAMWVKSQISKSEMHPADKAMLHTVTDIGKAVFSEVHRQLDAQWNREYVIALAIVCKLERLELILLEANSGTAIFLAFGGDEKLFFQCLNLPFILLRNNPTLAQKVSEARKQSSVVIYQRQ